MKYIIPNVALNGHMIYVRGNGGADASLVTIRAFLKCGTSPDAVEKIIESYGGPVHAPKLGMERLADIENHAVPDLRDELEDNGCIFHIHDEPDDPHMLRIAADAEWRKELDQSRCWPRTRHVVSPLLKWAFG